MNEIIGMEAASAPMPADERVGFAVTYVRRSVGVQFPVDEESLELVDDEAGSAED